MQNLQDPPLARFLFSDPRSGWIWLAVRLYVGWQWLHAGWGKLHNVKWVGDEAGAALTGFVNGALAKSAGAHPDVQSWYAWFLEHVILPHTDVWTHAIVWGELLVGVALILGAFTGIAAFFGAFMNLNFLLAGTVSVNPVIGPLAVLLVLAWKVAGWWGADRWLLPMLGTPWGRRTSS